MFKVGTVVVNPYRVDEGGIESRYKDKVLWFKDSN